MLFFNESVPNAKDVKGTVCLSECPSEAGQDVKCFRNSAFGDCQNVDTYPSYEYLERFCLASTNTDK